MKLNIILFFLLSLLFSHVSPYGGNVPKEIQTSLEKIVTTFQDKEGTVMATGADLKADSIRVELGQEYNQYFVVGQFKDPKKLEEITRQLLGEELSIYCNGELIAAPTVQTVLVSGEFSISGSFTLSEANELKELIKISAE
ncbi:SecDF P1 head subdomain-containing protein [Paenibacillus faecis]|uniref:SecDF P1 head subdomain-containing protein n=1 Tax=Paenibacillus faecis TaxID=862114 RepID=UPI001BCA70FB|nr:hypothetical protein [Paenibacillus faecis]